MVLFFVVIMLTDRIHEDSTKPDILGTIDGSSSLRNRVLLVSDPIFAYIYAVEAIFKVDAFIFGFVFNPIYPSLLNRTRS
jgi:hypothetical protein